MILAEGRYFGDVVLNSKLKSGDLSLTYYPKGAYLPAHSHSNPYISLLLGGEYIEKHGKLSKTVGGGSMIYRPISYEHENSFKKTSGYCFNIELYDPQLKMDLACLPRDQPVFTNDNLNIHKLYVGFLQNWQADELNCLLFESFTEINPLHKKYNNSSWVSQVIDYLNDNYYCDILISSIANEINIHPSYMARAFKKHTNSTIGEYLRKVRVYKAVSFFASTDRNLTSIAYTTGFYDQSHMIKNFKKEFDLTPNQVKKLFNIHI